MLGGKGQYDQQRTVGVQRMTTTQEGFAAITPDALSHNDRTGETMAKLP